MSTKSRGIPISSKTSTYQRRKRYPQDLHGEKVDDDIRLDVPARSAPATTFPSPTLSPKKFSTVDIFDSAIAGIQEFHLSPPCESSTRRSQLHSPPLQSPYLNSRSDCTNNNVHPLPLPPSRPVSWRSSLDKPEGPIIKGQWLKGKLLGRGSYGSVYEATNRYIVSMS